MFKTIFKYLGLSISLICFESIVFSQVCTNKVNAEITKVLNDSCNLSTSIKELFVCIENEGLCENFQSNKLYELINLIKEKTIKEEIFISLLIELDFIISRNAELGQYLSEIQHELALNNPKGFLNIYNNLSKQQKVMVKGNLIWLIENGKKDEFIYKLDSIEDIHQEIIHDLKLYLNKYD